MRTFKDYKENCVVTRIGQQICSYQGQICVLENYRVVVEIMDVPREECVQIREMENAILCLKADNKQVTARNFMFREMIGRQADENFMCHYFRC